MLLKPLIPSSAGLSDDVKSMLSLASLDPDVSRRSWFGGELVGEVSTRGCQAMCVSAPTLRSEAIYWESRFMSKVTITFLEWGVDSEPG